MIRRDGLVKVLDFGVATLTAAGTATSAAWVSGTPRYMSPEQLRGEPADTRSDVYSLGLTLYEMATGQKPSSTIAPTHAPSGLREILSRSIAPDPSQRYASGSEIRAALKKLSARRYSGPRQRSRKIAIGALAILSLCLLAFLLLRPASTPSYYSAVPLTSEPGAQLCPSFAPDEDRVAFSWDGEKEDNFDIYVKRIGGGAPLRLTSDPRPDLSPAWSPDGRSIAFIRFSPDNTGEVLLVPALYRCA